MHIPPDLDRDGLEWHRREVERTLNLLTTEAERWADEAGARPDERAAWRRTQRRPPRGSSAQVTSNLAPSAER
jgi:hypothetical protein